MARAGLTSSEPPPARRIPALGWREEDYALAVALRPAAESAYVVGATESGNMFSTVPLPLRGFQKNKAGSYDAFLLRLDPNQRAAGFLQPIADQLGQANVPLTF